MNWLVYHIASGHAFFTGVFLVVSAAIVSAYSSAMSKRFLVLAFFGGAIAILVSSTAIPYWYYALAVVLTAAWVASKYIKKWRRWSRLVVVAVWIVAAGIEYQFHRAPNLNQASARSLAILGDSITAGMGESDRAEKWPAILSKQYGIKVQDISHMGETAASALRRVRENAIAAPVVVLEIGGNDLLGSTTSEQFSRDLGALLEYVVAADRQVIMFELPLPPFYHEYGRIQRSLASKYSVLLVPKRYLLSILAAKDSTHDTIHLTQLGHERMAECVWQLISPAYAELEVTQSSDTSE